MLRFYIGVLNTNYIIGTKKGYKVCSFSYKIKIIRKLIRSTDLNVLFYIWENYDPKPWYHFLENVLFISFSSSVIFLWGTYHFPNFRWSGLGEITPVLHSKKERVIQEEGKYTKCLTSQTARMSATDSQTVIKASTGGKLLWLALRKLGWPTSQAIVTGREQSQETRQRMEQRPLEYLLGKEFSPSVSDWGSLHRIWEEHEYRE